MKLPLYLVCLFGFSNSALATWATLCEEGTDPNRNSDYSISVLLERFDGMAYLRIRGQSEARKLKCVAHDEGGRGDHLMAECQDCSYYLSVKSGKKGFFNSYRKVGLPKAELRDLDSRGSVLGEFFCVPHP